MKKISSRLARRAALAASTILSASAAMPALAQLAPPGPVRQSIDANGVALSDQMHQVVSRAG